MITRVARLERVHCIRLYVQTILNLAFAYIIELLFAIDKAIEDGACLTSLTKDTSLIRTLSTGPK